MINLDKEKFGYHLKDWWPKLNPLPDLIPVVGLVTWADRIRRSCGYSPREFYLRIPKKDEVFTLGTNDWPSPVDKSAAFRARLMAGRNTLFAAYQAYAVAVSVTYLARAVGIVG